MQSRRRVESVLDDCFLYEPTCKADAGSACALGHVHVLGVRDSWYEDSGSELPDVSSRLADNNWSPCAALAGLQMKVD